MEKETWKIVSAWKNKNGEKRWDNDDSTWNSHFRIRWWVQVFVVLRRCSFKKSQRKTKIFIAPEKKFGSTERNLFLSEATSIRIIPAVCCRRASIHPSHNDTVEKKSLFRNETGSWCWKSLKTCNSFRALSAVVKKLSLVFLLFFSGTRDKAIWKFDSSFWPWFITPKH